MSSSDPSTAGPDAPAAGSGEPAGGDERRAEPEAPAVVALVVAHGTAPHLDETLRSLADQRYPQLSVWVVSAGAAEDLTSRVAAVLPDASVRSVDDESSFAAAANEALAAVEGAPFLLFCHDDVSLDENALRLLITEAYRSNAGVVGPKIVDHDNPRILLDVGQSVDRFASPYPSVEPGEIDQEQHDAVRDVFFVSSTTLLIRADLFETLGGFDGATSPGAEDLDLCWRARLAGARVIIAPDARVRHHESSPEDHAGPSDAPRLYERRRLWTFLKNYSLPSLAWLVPAAVFLGAAETLVFLFTRSRSRAVAGLLAWGSTFGRLRELRTARRSSAASRRIADRDLRYLQARGSARAARFLSARLQTEERLATIGAAGRDAVEAASRRMRTRFTVATLVLIVVALFGARDLLFGRVPAVGELLPWSGVSELFGGFTSGWRFSGLGAAAPAPAAFALLGVGGSALLGDVALARTLAVVLTIPFGAWTMYRLVRPRSPSPGPAFAAALAYATVAVPRNAIAEGRLGAMVSYVLAPAMLAALLRAAGKAATGDEPNDRVDARRSLLRLTVMVAIATAFAPSALVIVPIMALALTLAVPLVGGPGLAWRALGRALLATAGAVVLLLPWPLAYASTGVGAGTLGAVVSVEGFSVADVLRFHTGPAGAGWLEWGLVAAAAFPLLVATRRRLQWAARAWIMALLSWALVWIPARFGGDVLVPPPELLLVPAALGLAFAVGVGAAAFVDDVPRFGFGWRQPAALAAGLALALPAVAFLGASADGRWQLPARGWDGALTFLDAEGEVSSFRALWVGDPEILPLDPWVRDVGDATVGFGTTRNGNGSALELWPIGDDDANAALGDALELALEAQTTRLGRLLGPMGVRYIVVPERDAPEGSAGPAPPGVVAALDRQDDLERRETDQAVSVYENEAWVPLRAVVPADTDLPVDPDDPATAGLRTEPGRVAVPVTGPLSDSSPVPPGLLLWSEAFDSDWSVSVEGEASDHEETFGWANGFAVPDGGSVDLSYGGQAVRWLLVAGEAVLWILLGWLWVRTGRRRRRRHG